MCWERFFTITGCAGFAKLFKWLINADLNAVIMVEPESEETRLLAGMFSIPFGSMRPSTGSASRLIDWIGRLSVAASPCASF